MNKYEVISPVYTVGGLVSPPEEECCYMVIEATSKWMAANLAVWEEEFRSWREASSVRWQDMATHVEVYLVEMSSVLRIGQV